MGVGRPLAGWPSALLLAASIVMEAAAVASAENSSTNATSASAASTDLFRTQVAPILQRSCVGCHNDADHKGDLSLQSAQGFARGGESGTPITSGKVGRGKAAKSLLIDYISGDKPEMPKNGTPLSRDEVTVIARWVDAGAHWPAGFTLQSRRAIDANWWSLLPIVRPELPRLSEEDARWCRTPIDRFIVAQLRVQKFAPSPEADRRTLIRRLYFDLIGLPPSADEVAAFVAEKDDRSYERLVDRLLASPRYGERWARHWLDVAHYGDTHGFDKDKLRPNAWPYRDYVIRALNDDKPYAQFVSEQLAGDVLYPDAEGSIAALGFIAAGPFDYVGHMEVAESTTDGQICRMLDRDDMVRTTMETFTSMTVGCARCHDHKFDPITQDDYYSLQAVFAGVDRADRKFDAHAEIARERSALVSRQEKADAERAEIVRRQMAAAGPELTRLDKRLAALPPPGSDENPAFGYHSAIETKPDVEKWVQLDLGKSVDIARLVFVGCYDTFNNIGAGFGFPVRFKIEVSDDGEFRRDVSTVLDRTHGDVPNPGVAPQNAEVHRSARYVRVTATRLAPRMNDFIFALAELMVFTADGKNVARGAKVTSLDSIEAPTRWSRQNLVDGIYFGREKLDSSRRAQLEEQRRALLERSLDMLMRGRLKQLDQEMTRLTDKLKALPPQQVVFAAAAHFAEEGNHHPSGGKPRDIHVLVRGNVGSPGRRVDPGAVASVASLPGRFTSAAQGDESRRRAALAAWITDAKNPLTWRSIVNRVWHYHFGRGLVDTPNDFGRMGSRPTHAELLDWLAAWFRDDGGQSLKQLHRMIVLSSAYRQVSSPPAAAAAQGELSAAMRLDGSNRYLWRMNRRKLEAEALRDEVLSVAGKLDLQMGGPGFRLFGLKDDHSPHYLYDQFDPDDVRTQRRSIYRFVVRSVPDPFMETLDCADPSTIVERRSETLTALQALALLNNKFMIRMSEHFAARVQASLPANADGPQQIGAAFRLSLGRDPSASERTALVDVARRHGLAPACRVIFNLNEFVFVD